MAEGRLGIVECGMAVSLQDFGRRNLRRFGVPCSGALDPLALAAANHLLGNKPDACGMEIMLSGPHLAIAGMPVAVALAGEISGQIQGDGAARPLPAWQAALLQPGERLKIAAPQRGTAYLAVSGGILVDSILGSRSFYGRAGLGRPLVEGEFLPCGAAGARHAHRPWRLAEGPIRLLPGPQLDYFGAEARDLLVGQEYRVARDSDRMGLRLIGAPLRHNEQGAECPTEAVLPGQIQIPADGQPIILLADAQTSGGYAKIAAVIAADLPRLAHLRPGEKLRFDWVDHGEAIALLRRQQRDFESWRETCRDSAGVIDQTALYRENLISGMVAGGDET